jgi:hypothetical protein
VSVQVGSGPGEQAKTRARLSGGLFGGGLQVGVDASFPYEFNVLSLHVALLFHLMDLQLELAAVTDELR